LSINNVIRNTINGLCNLATEAEKAVDYLKEDMDRTLEKQAERHAMELNKLVGDSPYDGTEEQNEANKLKIEAIKLDLDKMQQQFDAIRKGE